ncbi:MAG: hypothetical protein R2741_07695 [Methanolobus sp.]
MLREELDLPDYINLKDPENFPKFIKIHDMDIVIAIDEFQRFLNIYPSFITQLQRYWDMKSDDCKVFLIVSGSSIGMIRKDIQ